MQFVIYLSGALLAGGFILARLPGGWSEFVAVNEGANKFHMLEWADPLHNAQTFWTGLIGGAFVTMASRLPAYVVARPSVSAAANISSRSKTRSRPARRNAAS